MSSDPRQVPAGDALVKEVPSVSLPPKQLAYADSLLQVRLASDMVLASLLLLKASTEGRKTET